MSHTMTANVEALMSITEDYDLTRIWVNEDKAREMGIEDGDTVELSNEQYTAQCRVKTTQRIVPSTIYMPSHYGVTVEEQHTAYGIGLRPADFQKFALEPGYGSTMTHEIIVSMKKVGR